MEKVNLLGVKIDTLGLKDVLAEIARAIDTRERVLIAHVNVTAMRFAYEQAWFRNFLNTSDLVFCDGMGVQVGARILGYNIPERFTLADWMWPLAEMAQARGYSLFLLGNPPGVAERAAASLRQRFPDLLVAGARHGFFDQTPGSAESEAVIAQINAAKPHILLVGFGMPRQEEWLAHNWSRLQANVTLTCGALFEYLSGDLKRGPQWMTEHYLEWLARVMISPKRYAGRYLRDNSLFLVRILRQKVLGQYPE